MTILKINHVFHSIEVLSSNKGLVKENQKLGEKLPVHGIQKKKDLKQFLIEQSNQGLKHLIHVFPCAKMLNEWYL